MSFSINTNNANIGLQNASLNQNKSLNALSSGSKLTQAANDAASLAISDKLLAQVSGSGQAIQNANESIGLFQVADGALENIEDNTGRIRVLTLQASNDTLSSSDRVNIQKEIDSLSSSSNDIANQTSFNGIKLLDGSGGSEGNGTFITQSGANSGETQSVSIGDARALIVNVDVTTQAGRDSALGDIDDSLKSLSDTRATIGAGQNSLISSIRSGSLSQINEASSASQLRDVDFALESANLSKQNLLVQSGSFAQSQANSSKANVLGLLS